MVMEAQPTSQLPRGLLEAFNQSRVAIFIGAGASVASGMPAWDELVGHLADELNIPPDVGEGRFSPRLLAAIPQYYENRYGRRALTDAVRNYVPRHARKVSPIHELLAKLPCDLYYTTNFDLLLEHALATQNREFDLVASED